MMTAQQALDLLEAESLVLLVVASDVRSGKPVSESDWQRFVEAIGAVGHLRAEVYA